MCRRRTTQLLREKLEADKKKVKRDKPVDMLQRHDESKDHVGGKEGGEEIEGGRADARAESLRWTDRGIPHYSTTEACARRAKRAAKSAGCSLSEHSISKLPTLDEFLAKVNGKTNNFDLGELALTCFDLMFPPEAAQLFVDKVTFGLSNGILSVKHRLLSRWSGSFRHSASIGSGGFGTI